MEIKEKYNLSKNNSFGFNYVCDYFCNANNEEEILEFIKENVPQNRPLIPVDRAAHHVPLDQPLELVKSIKLITKSWM